MSDKEKIRQFIPQSDPMMMIDDLISSNEEETSTSFTVKTDNIFCESGLLREPGIIENMAQTAAARSGFEARKNNEPIKTGFIGSVKNLQINFLPKAEHTVHTTVSIMTVIGNISVIKAVMRCNQKIAAECEMTIILIDEL
jgi:predicted hotdog family 3-hydroxylacyl-ACP dehydratase